VKFISIVTLSVSVGASVLMTDLLNITSHEIWVFARALINYPIHLDSATSEQEMPSVHLNSESDNARLQVLNFTLFCETICHFHTATIRSWII